MLDRPSYKLIASAPEMAHAMWPIVAPMIARAFEASDQIVPVDIVEQLRSGKRVLWLVVEPVGMTIVAAGMTRIFQRRSGKTCQILETAGDDARHWIHTRAEIEAYAKAEGCDRVLIEGRPGWARLFPDYQVTAVILEKRI